SAPLDGTALEQALRCVLGRHAALRLRFECDADGRWCQRLATLEEAKRSGEALLWRRESADAAAITSLAAEAQRSLDLQRGPLLRVVWIRTPGLGERLLLVAHHLVVDTVSWRILLEDLASAYRQVCAGEQPELASKTCSFARWSQELQVLAARASSELQYWA